MLLSSSYIFRDVAARSHNYLAHIAPVLLGAALLLYLYPRIIKSAQKSKYTGLRQIFVLFLPFTALLWTYCAFQETFKAIRIKKHYQEACGLTVGKFRHARGGGDYIKFDYRVVGKSYTSEDIELGSDTAKFDNIIAKGGRYAVYYNAQEPSECFLDASSPLVNCNGIE